MAKLQEPIPVNFNANKLSSVVDYFKNTTGLDLDVKWAPSKAHAGIEENTPVTAQFTNVPAAKALQVILDNLSPANDKRNHLDYTIADGTLRISTHDDLTSPENLELRVWRRTRPVDRTRGGSPRPPGQKELRRPAPLVRPVSRNWPSFVKQIYDTVRSPEEQRERVPDGTSTIDSFNNNLLVRTTAKNQADLRRVPGAATPCRTRRPKRPQGQGRVAIWRSKPKRQPQSQETRRRRAEPCQQGAGPSHH